MLGSIIFRLVGGEFIWFPYWLVATLVGIGFAIGIGIAIVKRSARKRSIALSKIYSQEGDSIYGRRRKLYD